MSTGMSMRVSHAPPMPKELLAARRRELQAVTAISQMSTELVDFAKATAQQQDLMADGGIGIFYYPRASAKLA